MKVLSDIAEHNNIKILSIFTIGLGFALDALNQTEYFYIAMIIVVIVLLITTLDTLKMHKVYKTDTIHIPIVINISSNESVKYALKNLFKDIEQKEGLKNLKHNLKKYNNIVEDDLVFHYNGDIFDTKRFISFTQIIKYQITKIKENLPNKVHFHLAYYNKPSLGFVIGHLFEEEELTIYQQNQVKDSFNKVAVLKTREYKTHVKDYSKFMVTKMLKEDESKSVLLTIKAASHNIAMNASSLDMYTNRVEMYANHSGEILEDEDWVLYAREIFTQLNELQTHYTQITIAHAMPEALAVIVGKSISNYWNIQMTQYSDGEYKNIIKLNDVKCYF